MRTLAQIQPAVEHAIQQLSTVGLSHPEALAALVGGRTEITAHFATQPFQSEELRHPSIRRVATSYDATDGPSTTTAVWTTARFFGENPLVVEAVTSALDEATQFVRAHPRDAAAVYREADEPSRSLDELTACVRDPDVVWTLAPQRALSFSSFLARTGRLSRAPVDARELFFPGPALRGT